MTGHGCPIEATMAIGCRITNGELHWCTVCGRLMLCNGETLIPALIAVREENGQAGKQEISSNVSTAARLLDRATGTVSC